MDYEKEYKEALERAKYIYNSPCKPAEAATIKETLTSIFPFLADELAESEDEKIKKEIKVILANTDLSQFALDYTFADMITWLEKQGTSYTKRDIDDAYLKGISDAKNELEKQGNSFIKWNKNTKDNKPQFNHSVFMLTKSGISEGEWRGGNQWLQYRWSGIVKDSDVIGWMELSVLEKQGEQKSTDEPKFHEGEWITNGDYTWKIVEIKPLDYILQSQDGNIVDDTIYHVDEQFHSFNIEDAKNGDVLAINWQEGDDSWEKIIIFKKYHNKGVKGLYNMPCVEGYGDTFKNGKLAINEEVPYYSKTWTAYLHPATKEQRDFLFQKMKEKGYMWDAEKKELKKIEQKSVGEEIVEALRTEYEKGRADAFAEMQKEWSEEDKNFMYDTLSNLTELKDRYGEGYGNVGRCIDWVKDLKDRVQPQPKQEWSEEDEVLLSSIINTLEMIEGSGASKMKIDFLKHLKQRYTWKPSDEQMETLELIINSHSLDAYHLGMLQHLYNGLNTLKG